MARILGLDLGAYSVKGVWLETAMRGYRELHAAQRVTFVVQRPTGGQDGYPFTALQVRPIAADPN